MTAQERIDKIVATIQARVDSFNSAIPDVEKRVYKRLLEMLKDLKIVNGRVVNGVENIDKISKIIPEIEQIIVDAGYEKKVASFGQAFDEVANLQKNYFSSLNVQFTPKKILTKLLDVNKKWTVEKLSQRGISADFSPAMRDILDRAMTSGAEYADLAEQIRSHVLSGEAGPGALARYSRQVATDSLNFFSANYNETITADLGLKWRVYTGSLLETSREWCVHMVEKKYVHEAELNDVITKEINGVEIGSEDIPVNKKTGLPRGMMEGTNADTIKANRGGWQCGHQWAAVTESMVPLDVRIRTYNKYGIKHYQGIATPESVIKKTKEMVGSNRAALTEKALNERQRKLYESIDRDKSLKGDDAILQDLSIKKLSMNQEQMVEAYLKDNDNVINTDEARKQFIDIGYNGNNASAVHEASSTLGKLALKKLVEKGKNNRISFYAGGAGSCKTSTIETLLPNIKQTSDAIIDGNLSGYNKAVSKIDEYLNMGKTVEIAYVSRPTEEAWEAVILRMLNNKSEMGRGVRSTTFIENTTGSYNTIKAILASDLAKDGLVTIHLFDNGLGKGNAKVMDMEKFNSISFPDDIYTKLKAITDRYYKEGKISKEQYDMLLQ